MLRGVRVAVVVVTVVAVAAGGVVAMETNENQAPMPAAGLDQSVQEGSVVYLDAGGSYDPDGSIARYRWTITAPNGTTFRPRCGSCVLTRFVPERAGTYDVRVTVTDDDGASRSDTLYVTVGAAAPPTVDVSGPSNVTAGQKVTFTADVRAGDHVLSALVWTTNGTVLARQQLSGEAATRRLTHTFTEAGPATLRVQATDRIEEVGTARHVVDVTATRSSPPSTGGPTSGGPGGRTPSLYRPVGPASPTQAYQLMLTNGVVTYGGDANKVLFDREQVERLKHKPGVNLTTNTMWATASTHDSGKALRITNPRIQNQIDKEAGKKGYGFADSTVNRVSADGDYSLTKWSPTDPGPKWTRIGKKVTATKKKDKPASKSNYKLVDTIAVPTGETYVAKQPRDSNDVRVGTGTKTKYEWVSYRWATNGGTVVDKRPEKYTWEVRRTRTDEKVVSREIVKEPVYGERTVTEEVVVWQGCVREKTVLGRTICMEHDTKTKMKTYTETYVKEYTYDYVIKTKTVTETYWVSKSGSSKPINGYDVRNIDPNYEYRVATTKQVPKWKVVNTKYRYEVHTYKWGFINS